MNPVQLAAMHDELEKIGGGIVRKMLLTNITPGAGPLRKRLAQGFRNVGQTARSEVAREGGGAKGVAKALMTPWG
jgi:hypothetical protein